MSLPKKSVLTKGIQDFNLPHGRFENEEKDAYSKALEALSTCPYDELVALRTTSPNEIFVVMKNLGVDDETAREAIALVKGDSYASILASVFAPRAIGTENMTNLRTPGSPSPKIAVEPGKSGQNVRGENPDITSGPEHPEGQEGIGYGVTPRSGYPVEIGRERYTETRQTAGTSEDLQSIRTRYHPPNATVLGETNPDFAVRQGGRGASGNYGRQTSLVTQSTAKSLAQRDREQANFTRKVAGPSNAEIQEIVAVEERRQGYRLSEEIPVDIMRKAREVAARNAQTDSRWVETVVEIDKEILRKKVSKMFQK